MKLVLGVLDVGYTHAKGSDLTANENTTGDVAEVLEKRYHVFETFYLLNQAKVANAVADSMAASLQAVINGQRPEHRSSFTAAGDAKIETAFRAFLASNVMASLIGTVSPVPGVGIVGGFTGAGSRGVNHRRLHPYARKNRARPAFIDTGLYMRSFRAWTTRSGG